MKKVLFISLKIALLLVFTTTYTSAWACDKSKTKKEVKHTDTKCQKTCCKNAQSNSSSNCKNTCCKKQKHSSDIQKKGCCSDGDCTCSVTTNVLADLSKQFILDFPNSLPVFILKNDFFYKQVFSNTSINDIWQPPISVLS